jgi:hypothetical protein
MNNTNRSSLGKFSAWLSGAALGLMLSAANAGVLVSHQPNGGIGYESSIDAGLQNADFTFNGNADIESISWWGTFVPDDDLDLFTVRIFNGLGLPDTFTLVPSATTTRTTDGNLFRFYLDLTSAPVSLASGNYFLSIMNETAHHVTANWSWWTSTSSSPDRDGNNHFRSNDDETWADDSTGDFAFELSGTQHIPEPDTTALLLLAGLGLMLVRRRVV